LLKRIGPRLLYDRYFLPRQNRREQEALNGKPALLIVEQCA